MRMVTFDTLRAAQRLRDEADQSPAAAETIAAVIGEAVTPGRDDVAVLRGELHQEVAALRGEIADLRTELHEQLGAVREEIADLRGELREGLQAMRTEMQTMRADFQSDMRTLQLQLAGFGVAVATVAVAIVKLV